MDRRAHVHVMADDPSDRAAWVAALAREHGIAVVGAGAVTFDGATPSSDEDGAILVVVAPAEPAAEVEALWAIAERGASAVVLVGSDDAVGVDPARSVWSVDAGEVSEGSYAAVDARGPARISADSPPERVAAAVWAVAFGLQVSDPLVAENAAARFPVDEESDLGDLRATMTPSVRANVDSDGILEPVTDRERDVLEALVDGSTNRQIATALAISEHTVKFHLASLLSKFGASTRTELVVRAIQAGVLQV